MKFLIYFITFSAICIHCQLFLSVVVVVVVVVVVISANLFINFWHFWHMSHMKVQVKSYHSCKCENLSWYVSGLCKPCCNYEYNCPWANANEYQILPLHQTANFGFRQGYNHHSHQPRPFILLLNHTTTSNCKFWFLAGFFLWKDSVYFLFLQPFSSILPWNWWLLKSANLIFVWV